MKVRQLLSLDPEDHQLLQEAAAREGIKPTLLARMFVRRGLEPYRAGSQTEEKSE